LDLLKLGRVELRVKEIHIEKPEPESRSDSLAEEDEDREEENEGGQEPVPINNANNLPNDIEELSRSKTIAPPPNYKSDTRFNKQYSEIMI
jgi:hypothetical protein